MLIHRFSGGPRLDLIDALELPTNLKWLKNLDGVPARQTLDLRRFGALDRRLSRYVWDPSGQYIAITTGPFSREESRVHVLHFDTGDLVAAISPSAIALGWSPGGRLLLCQRQVDDGAPEVVVWDSHSWDVRALAEGDRREFWSRQIEFLSATARAEGSVLNADGTLYAHGHTIYNAASGEIETVLPLKGEVLHAAWSPRDPHCIATVGGGPMLRIWRRVAA